MTGVAVDQHADVDPHPLDAAKSAERSGRWAAARTEYERLLASPEDVAGGRGALLRWIGRTYLEEGHPDIALEQFAAALQTAESEQDAAGIAHATNWLAIGEQQMGNLDRSEELYSQARARADRAGEHALVAMIDQNLGTIASIRGNLDLALRCYEASLNRYHALDMHEYEAHVLNNMGMLYTDLGDWAEAEGAYERALVVCAALSDSNHQVRVRVNQIKLWLARKEIEKAREWCESLLADCAGVGSPSDAPWVGDVYKHYGVVLRELADYPNAEDYLKRAAQVSVATWDLLLAAETAREQAELYWRQHRYTDTLRSLNRAQGWFTQLRAQRELTMLEQRNARLENRFLDVVQKWGQSIESKDRYTQGHCERVADIACALAKRIGLDEKTLFWFRIGALLHDVGKLIIPSEVLNKPGKLNEDEWHLMRRHPEAGVELLADIEFPWDVRPMIRNHHEKWDGTGYPDQLAGEEISLSARLLCLADIYDALTTTRAYRTGFTHERAVEIMSDMSGQFDPRLFKVFLEWATVQARVGAAAVAA